MINLSTASSFGKEWRCLYLKLCKAHEAKEKKKSPYIIIIIIIISIHHPAQRLDFVPAENARKGW